MQDIARSLKHHIDVSQDFTWQGPTIDLGSDHYFQADGTANWYLTDKNEMWVRLSQNLYNWSDKDDVAFDKAILYTCISYYD